MHPTTTPSPTATHRVERRSTGLVARAWWGETLLAESSATIRVEEDGQPPALYFPVADVREELLHEERHELTCPVKGIARLWSIGDDDAGREALWSFHEPSPGCAWLSGYAAFDHDRVRVELLDGRRGEPDEAATITRFPTWGDATDLVDLLDVRPDGEHRYVTGARPDWRRPVVEGSQMLGQAIVAGMRHSGGRRAVSANMVFARVADASRPLQIDIDEVANGRTFTALAVPVTQDGRRVATGTLLLDARAPDVIRHAVAPPPVPGPDQCPPSDMSVTGRDVRVVDGAYSSDPGAPPGPPELDAWVRIREVPDDPALHAALLTQFSGHLSIAAALRPHPGVGEQQAHHTLSTAVNAITIAFHREVRADRWMLYRHLSTFAGDGMTHSECRVHDEAGDLLASFTVDAMVRGFTPRHADADARTAL